MSGHSRRDPRGPTAVGGSVAGTGALPGPGKGDAARVAGDPGVLGTALAVVLAFSLAEGSWE
ncbi:hypothetical protein ACFVH7_22270 [Kitasatospora indigofera]|uniref:hypothetical protein n=1 Tax=Kitasatospora indigofera TaxID=67307 RepID=UPI00363045A7